MHIQAIRAECQMTFELAVPSHAPFVRHFCVMSGLGGDVGSVTQASAKAPVGSRGIILARSSPPMTKSLVTAPALSECGHRSLARRLLIADRCVCDSQRRECAPSKNDESEVPQLGVALCRIHEGRCVWRAGVEWWARRLRTPLTSTLAAECGCGGRCSQ
jgi:hypothetical protein